MIERLALRLCFSQAEATGFSLSCSILQWVPPESYILVFQFFFDHSRP